jgi:hypothetical protein
MAEITKRAPDELVYASVDPSKRNKPSLALLQLVSLPVVVAGALSMAVSGTAALVGLVASTAFSIWWWKRAPQLAEKRLCVRDGRLFVFRRHLEEARFDLDELTDVVLDSKTVQKIQEGGSAIPAMRFIDSQVAPDQDVSRIVLVGKKRRHPLADDYVANMEATEWLGKIRVFLRKHGWVPKDERADAPESAAPESDE